MGVSIVMVLPPEMDENWGEAYDEMVKSHRNSASETLNFTKCLAGFSSTELAQLSDLRPSLLRWHLRCW